MPLITEDDFRFPAPSRERSGLLESRSGKFKIQQPRGATLLLTQQQHRAQAHLLRQSADLQVRKLAAHHENLANAIEAGRGSRVLRGGELGHAREAAGFVLNAAATYFYTSAYGCPKNSAKNKKNGALRIKMML